MCGTWALTLQYLPDGDLATRCSKQVIHRWFVWSELAIPKGELDFRTMYRVLHKLPQDRETASAAQYTEWIVENLSSLPATGPWQRLEDVEWRLMMLSAGEELFFAQEVRSRSALSRWLRRRGSPPLYTHLLRRCAGQLGVKRWYV